MLHKAQQLVLREWDAAVRKLAGDGEAGRQPDTQKLSESNLNTDYILNADTPHTFKPATMCNMSVICTGWDSLSLLASNLNA